jgi:hypothetical protein
MHKNSDMASAGGVCPFFFTTRFLSKEWNRLINGIEHRVLYFVVICEKQVRNSECWNEGTHGIPARRIAEFEWRLKLRSSTTDTITIFVALLTCC